MIEFTALAIACGMAAGAFGTEADKRLAKRQSALVQTLIGFVLLVSALAFFFMALQTAPWGAL